MTTQIPQIQSPAGPSLFQDSSIPSPSKQIFQDYLEKEQKRLALLFNPYGQFDFSAWFSYFKSAEDSTYDHGVTSSPQTETAPTPTTKPSEPTITYQAWDQANLDSAAKPMQAFLQDVLLKSGLIAPNLETFNLLYQAQLQGKLLESFDLQSLVDQIVSQVKLVKEKGKVELTIGLKPENLGEIILTLTARAGMISVQIQAPEATRKLLQDQIQELELALKKAKIDLADLKIMELKGGRENA